MKRSRPKREKEGKGRNENKKRKNMGKKRKGRQDVRQKEMNERFTKKNDD